MDTSSTKFSLVFLKIIEQHPVNLTNFVKFRIIFRGSFFCSLSDCSRVALRERRRLLLHETSLGDTVPDNTSHILARWQEHPCEMARRSIEVFENMRGNQNVRARWRKKCRLARVSMSDGKNIYVRWRERLSRASKIHIR